MINYNIKVRSPFISTSYILGEALLGQALDLGYPSPYHTF